MRGGLLVCAQVICSHSVVVCVLGAVWITRSPELDYIVTVFNASCEEHEKEVAALVSVACAQPQANIQRHGLGL